MAAKALFVILALAFIAGSESARIIETDSKVQFDPCTLLLKPWWCYLQHPSSSPPASPVVQTPPATPVVRPSPPASPVVRPFPPATCAPAADLIQNCGMYFYISRAAHDYCCQQVNAMSDACLANDVIFSLIERELLFIAKGICASQPPRFGPNAATDTFKASSP